MPVTLDYARSQEPEPLDEECSIRRALPRALLRGSIWVVVLVALTLPAAIYLPLLVLNGWLRVAIAFGVAWILIGAVQTGAGTVGWWCDALTAFLTACVLFSHHVVFALHGVQLRDGSHVGLMWLAPYVLARLNFVPAVAIAVCLWISHDGRPDGSFIVDVLKQRAWRI